VRKLRFSPLARGDMDLIAAYIAQDDRAAARRVIESFHAAAKRLTRMPGLGHRRPDLTSRPLLFWTASSHLIVYRRATDGIEFVRVIHGARDARRLLSDEE